jgi:hypothetical protein
MEDDHLKEYLEAEIDRNLQASMEKRITVKGLNGGLSYLKVNLEYTAYDFLVEQLLPIHRLTFSDLKDENMLYHSSRYGKMFILIPGRY